MKRTFLPANNDTRGHDIGDRVLQVLSRTISSTLSDIDLLFRMRGEELVAILPDTSLNNASIVAPWPAESKMRSNRRSSPIKIDCSEPVPVELMPLSAETVAPAK